MLFFGKGDQTTGVTVRKKLGSKDWWIFVHHDGKRRSKKIGPVKKDAEDIARRLRLKNTAPEPNPFDFDELKKILAVTDNHFNLCPLIYTAFYSGLRIGELLGMRWEDVDFDDKLIWVRHTYHGHGRFGPPKSRKERFVEMADSLLAVLKAHRTDEMKKGLRLRGGTLPQQVFTNAYGRAISGEHVRHEWAKVLTAAGMPYRKLHSTRATYTSHLLMNGADPYWVKEQLGHSSIRTLETAYAKYIPTKDRVSQVNLLDTPKPNPLRTQIGGCKK